jgi:hypothetical protein
MTRKPDMLLWLNDARGIYIPRDFANSFSDRAKHVTGVTAHQWETLEAGPSHEDESYWDVWTEVCDNATVTDENGHKYSVYQDGDCWLIPHGMEWNEDTDSFDWPDERESEDDDED